MLCTEKIISTVITSLRFVKIDNDKKRERERERERGEK